MRDARREKPMENVKPCPFCGEQILAVAVKCKHCGSAIGAAPGPIRKQFSMRPWATTAAVVIAVLFVLGYLSNWMQTGTLSGKGLFERRHPTGRGQHQKRISEAT